MSKNITDKSKERSDKEFEENLKALKDGNPVKPSGGLEDNLARYWFSMAWNELYPYKERCETLEAKVKELEERATISGGAWDSAKDYCRRFEKFWAKKYEEKVLKLRTVEAKVKELEEKRDSLFVVIKHGDRPHQDWLREVIYNHFTDEPMPEYVPSNRDKKIQALEAKVKDYESSHRGACFTCEPVGELNKKLEALLIEACGLSGCRCSCTIGDCVWCEFKNKPEIKKLLEGG